MIACEWEGRIGDKISHLNAFQTYYEIYCKGKKTDIIGDSVCEHKEPPDTDALEHAGSTYPALVRAGMSRAVLQLEGRILLLASFQHEPMEQ